MTLPVEFLITGIGESRFLPNGMQWRMSLPFSAWPTSTKATGPDVRGRAFTTLRQLAGTHGQDRPQHTKKEDLTSSSVVSRAGCCICHPRVDDLNVRRLEQGDIARGNRGPAMDGNSRDQPSRKPMVRPRRRATARTSPIRSAAPRSNGNNRSENNSTVSESLRSRSQRRLPASRL